MKHYRITLEDLAVELGVSISTVSRALSNHPALPLETIEKVKTLALERKYRPNLRAKALKSSESKIIALIVPEINMFFVPELIYGVTAKGNEKGYSVMVFQSENQFRKEKELLNYAINLPVDGVLMSISEETVNFEHLKEALEYGIPIVLVDKVSQSEYFPQVTVNDIEITTLAVSHLIQNGHKNILGLFGNEALTMTKKRKIGFELAFEQAQVLYSNETVVSVEQILEIDLVLTHFFSKQNQITAIFCMSDELLVNTHHWLQKNQIAVPDDISLIAISDGFLPYYLYPNISHVYHSGFEVGCKAFELLLEQFQQNKQLKSIKTISTKLYPMDSVKNLNIF